MDADDNDDDYEDVDDEENTLYEVPTRREEHNDDVDEPDYMEFEGWGMMETLFGLWYTLVEFRLQGDKINGENNTEHSAIL